MRAETAASLAINEKAPALAAAVVERAFASRPELAPRFGPQGRAQSVEDSRYHFAFLALALEFARPELFARYVTWAKPLLAHRRVPPDVLAHHLERMGDELESSLAPEPARAALAYLRTAIAAVSGAPESLDTDLGKLPAPAAEYLRRMLANDAPGAREFALDALRHGMGAGELCLKVLAPAMHEVGLLWQAARIDVAQEHFCAGVTQGVLAEVNASLRSVRAGRTAVVACVAGEQHSLGSRMVADFLDMSGWRTLWLGASTPSADLLRMVCDLGADLLAISCTYAPHLHDVASLITAMRALPECRKVKVMVGGHAFGWCDGLWRDVGADGHAEDAARAAQLAHRLVA